MSENGPGNVALLELVDRDLTREGAVWLVEDVLCGDLDAFTEMLTGEQEVERRGSNDNLCALLARGSGTEQDQLASVRVELSLVEVLDDFGDGLDGPVPLLSGQSQALRDAGTHSSAGDEHLKVSSDEELATHFGGMLVYDVGLCLW